MSVSGFEYTLDDLLKRYGRDYADLKPLLKEHLEWQKDYRLGGRKDRLRFTKAARAKLDKVLLHKNDALFAADEGEVIRAVVHRIQPKNPRCMYVVAPEIEGKGLCQIPLRKVKEYRRPGKVVFVRHVDGQTYQIVLKSWRNE